MNVRRELRELVVGCHAGICSCMQTQALALCILVRAGACSGAPAFMCA